MYIVELVLPKTKEGKEELEKRYAEVLAKITLKKLSTEEVQMVIDMLESKR